MRIIAGTARSRQLKAPKGLDTRPTLDRVRENLFNILGLRVRDAWVLDLFSGSGALALEALSRGAAHTVLVDHDRQAHLVEKENAAALGFQERCDIRLCEASRAVAALTAEKAQFQLFFLDPPYAMGDLRQLTAALLPLAAEDALLVTEHQAGQPYQVDAGWQLTDARKYGYAGLSFYRPAREEDT